MVLYYNPCTNMFPSGATTHHSLHRSVSSSSTPTFNFPSASTALTVDQNCYPLYNSNNSNNNSNNSNSPTVATLASGPQLGLSTSPTSQYSSELGAMPTMTSDVLQQTGLSGPHANAWYSIPPTMPSQTGPCPVRGSMMSGSPYDEWPPAPNTGSPLSASSPCISGSPVSALPTCAYAMSLQGTYGQPLQVGPYHPHSVHRSDHYSDHLHHYSHHHHPHPYQNSGLIPTITSEATPVHPSPDSGLTASSDGTESPNAHQNNNTNGLNTTPNGTIIKSENNNGANRPQPARSPYEWMKKPSYQNQINPGNPPISKTRTKDKYRVVYSDHQRLELEKEFHYSRYITIRRKSELASMLSLSERQVKIWFQNRRAKERKQAKKRDEIIRKEKEHHVVHNHSQQIHNNFGLIS